MLIQDLNTFKEATRPYKIEGGFNRLQESGHELFYGYDVGMKIPENNIRKAYIHYKANAQAYDKHATLYGFVMDKYLTKCMVFDNGGESIDRYTIIYPEVFTNHWGEKYRVYVGSSLYARGFFQHGEIPVMRSYCHLGKRIQLSDLHKDVQRAIRLDARR